MMNNRETILPDSVAIFPNILAFDLATKEYLESLRLELLLIYFIDQVDARALPILGRQFDVLGNKGFRLATSEQQKRDILKRAIELHRYKGTVWAVKESLKSIGFHDIILTEHTGGHWAKFRLSIQNQNVILGDAQFADIVAMVEEYKNVRSYLDGLVVSIDIDGDTIEFDEDFAEINEEISAGEDLIVFSGDMFYDGADDYDGSHDHSGDADVISITP
jgi:P2-related tail formation protein